MTIGIAAYGPNAGLAVYTALAAVEHVATGSIRGYAAFAAISQSGTLLRAQTQRGGTSTLFVDGENTGVNPPSDVAAARMAAVMSSGPDRPEPLAQFVPGEAGVGLVTGHRLPNAAGVTGRAVNQEVLQRLREGLDARRAVDTVLDADPESDAGIIAVDSRGGVHARNSDRVARRPDLGHARRSDMFTEATVEVLHNAIFPMDSLAALAADIALAVMVPRDRLAGCLRVNAGTPVHHGAENRVIVDADGSALTVETTDRRILAGRHNCAAVYLGAAVVRDGEVLGHTVVEPNVVVEDGRIVSLSGQSGVNIGYR